MEEQLEQLLMRKLKMLLFCAIYLRLTLILISSVWTRTRKEREGGKAVLELEKYDGASVGLLIDEACNLEIEPVQAVKTTNHQKKNTADDGGDGDGDDANESNAQVK